MVGKEAQAEWKKDPGATFAIHAGIGAAEGLIAGTIGTIVDGAYPAASAELSQVPGVAGEDEAVQLTEQSWQSAGVGADSNPATTTVRRVAGRGLVRSNASTVTATSHQAFTFVVKNPSSFLKILHLGGAAAKTILKTKRGMAKYLIKIFGIVWTEVQLLSYPKSEIDKLKGRSVPAATEDGEAAPTANSFHPVVMHVQGCISRAGLPAVHGHMHIATAATEPGDSRSAISSDTYAYVTHSPTERAFIQFEDSKAGDGFHIRTSKDSYLSVARTYKTDRRGKNTSFVHATTYDQAYPPATWAVEIYEESNVVLKLIDSGDPSGSRMNGGYLAARFNKKSDWRKDGGAYLCVHNKPNGNHKASLFGFRVMRQDKLWWMDVVGDYECHDYDNGGKNDHHYVTIAESVDHQGLYWMNRSKIAWALTPQIGTRDTLRTHKDCIYFKAGHTECKVIFDSDQNVLGVLGPYNERYERLWWRDLDGMMFDGPDDGEHVSFTRAPANRNYMILHRRFSTGARVSQILEGDYLNRNALHDVSGGSFVEIMRDEFGGLVTGLKYEGVSFKRYSLVELLGRYVTQTEDKKSKRVVSTYMSIHGSRKGTAEVWWQSTNGETWTLKYVSRNKLVVGETCPYLKAGYAECSISRNADGGVDSLLGPGGKIFKRL